MWQEGGGGGAEPAGSEGAKFRLWVKSKGLSLRPGPGEASSQQQDTEADTRLYLPTGTEQVRILFLVLVIYFKTRRLDNVLGGAGCEAGVNLVRD